MAPLDTGGTHMLAEWGGVFERPDHSKEKSTKNSLI